MAIVGGRLADCVTRALVRRLPEHRVATAASI